MKQKLASHIKQIKYHKLILEISLFLCEPWHDSLPGKIKKTTEQFGGLKRNYANCSWFWVNNKTVCHWILRNVTHCNRVYLGINTASQPDCIQASWLAELKDLCTQFLTGKRWSYFLMAFSPQSQNWNFNMTTFWLSFSCKEGIKQTEKPLATHWLQ